MEYEDTIEARLDRIELVLYRLQAAIKLLAKEERMAQADIDALKAAVERNTSVTDSAVVLIQGLAQQIKDAADDPAQLQALAAQIDKEAGELAAAVTAGTPATP